MHQFALWLVLVTGVRAGELFGLRVHDWLDARDSDWPYPAQQGVGGLLRVERQGGRRITSRDDFTGQVTTGSTGPTKTEQSVRVVVVPELLAELIRLVIEVFHTDPVSGELAAQASLIPVMNSETGGQGTFWNALTRVLAVLELPAASPHDLRRRLVSEIRDAGFTDDKVLQRLLGHRPGTEVLSVHYLQDTPDLLQLREVAAITNSIMTRQLSGPLMTPTTKREVLRAGQANLVAWAGYAGRLFDVGWRVRELDQSDHCSVAEFSELIGAAQGTIRRAVREGTIAGTRGRRNSRDVILVPRAEVERVLDRQQDLMTLPVLAAELGIPYLELWKLQRGMEGIYLQGSVLVMEPEAEKKLRARAQVWLERRGRSISAKDVAEALGCSELAARQLLQRVGMPRDAHDNKRFERAAVEAWFARRRGRTSRGVLAARPAG